MTCRVCGKAMMVVEMSSYGVETCYATFECVNKHRRSEETDCPEYDQWDDENRGREER
jgi:hypothetical protein